MAQYEYCVLPQTSDEALQSFAKQLELSDPAPYQVLQQDQHAHVVFHRDSNTIGYAIFATPTPKGSAPWLPKGPLSGVSQACLVMIEEKGPQMIVSLTHPDIRPEEKQARRISITLSGHYLPSAGTPSLYTVEHKNGNRTTITVPVLHGESHSLNLNKK